MAHQKGYYVWDDDLHPGHRSDGSFHQNLYDDDGGLVGHARFVPISDEDDEPDDENVFIPSEGRRTDADDEALAEVAATLVAMIVTAGVVVAAPRVQQWWSSSVVPLARRAASHLPRIHRSAASDAPGEEGLPSQDEAASAVVYVDPLANAGIDVITPDLRPHMSRNEAQARLLAALSARAFADEQFRLVTASKIDDLDGTDKTQRILAGIDEKQATELVVHLARYPELLSEEHLADLAALLSSKRQEGIAE